MNIPKLDRSGRKREYKNYSPYLRSIIVKEFLFNGVEHRQLDTEILNLDPKQSLGFQSMGILHYLGLKQQFKGIFEGIEISDAMFLSTKSYDNNKIPTIEATKKAS